MTQKARAILKSLKIKQVELKRLESDLKDKTKIFTDEIRSVFKKDQITPIDVMEFTLESVENDRF